MTKRAGWTGSDDEVGISLFKVILKDLTMVFDKINSSFKWELYRYFLISFPISAASEISPKTMLFIGPFQNCNLFKLNATVMNLHRIIQILRIIH